MNSELIAIPVLRYTSMALLGVALCAAIFASASGQQEGDAAATTPTAGAPADATADTTEPPAAEPLDSAAADATAADGTAEDGAAADAAAADDASGGPPWYVLLLIVIAVLALPFAIGNSLGKSLRMPDHAWKMGLTLCTCAVSAVVVGFGWPPQLGTDLSGGVNLIYEIDQSALAEGQEIPMDELVQAVAERVNPGGVKEVTVRPYGSQQVELIIPLAEDAEIELIKRKIYTAGALEFRITANTNDHADIIQLGRLARDQGLKTVEQDGKTVGRWVRLNESEFDPQRDEHLITAQNKRGDWEVLIVIDQYNVTGEYLRNATSGVDQRGSPAVNFTFDTRGARLFYNLSRANEPIRATQFYRHLGIILDDELRSAPVIESAISDRGQISGSFTREEVDFLISILNAGRLPASLNKTPISQETVSATLGADTVRQGSLAISASMIAVLLFMLVYYRFAGVVACLALAANLLFVLGLMISINAALTLPGLAGLVLTVGMAVDANVLIFERIREEIARGSAMRMAIRNGFAKATVTIVDANLTTLITAIVLYWIGTDQIRGFAVTLILGIVMSMYTAIFCSRIIFDIGERRKWITQLNMMRLIGNTSIDFISKRRLAGAASLTLIVVGLTAVVGRGTNLLDIDFTGGTSVTLLFEDGHGIDITSIRKQLDDDETLEDLAVVGVGDQNLQFKINTRNRDIGAVQARLREIFGDKLRTNSLRYETLAQIEAAVPPAAEVPAADDAASAPAADAAPTGDPPADATDATSDEETAADSAEAGSEAADEGTDAAGSDATTAPPAVNDPYEGGTRTTLVFGEPIKHDTLAELLGTAMDEANLSEVPFALDHADYVSDSQVPFAEWELDIALSPDRAAPVLESVGRQLSRVPVFPSSSNIGGKVAGDTQVQAGYALVASLIFIVGYIWLRFQHIVFGLAAVVALVHDVLITLGVLALSGYLVTYAEPLANVLLVDPFKISLPIVAAFLTIIGYSLNDTIVVFDRIREVRGKSPDVTEAIVNTSINQTLSRTVLTSLTTLLVVAILYAAGGSGIHGFAFALVVGVMVGTYSSIFVASPALLWMSRSQANASQRSSAARSVQAAAAKAGGL